MTTKPRRNEKERARHFLSIWAEDPTLKARMIALAESEDRTMGNYFNRYLVPVIEKVVEREFQKLPMDVRKRALGSAGE